MIVNKKKDSKEATKFAYLAQVGPSPYTRVVTPARVCN